MWTSVKVPPLHSHGQNGLDSVLLRAYLASHLCRQERLVECVAQQILASP